MLKPFRLMTPAEAASHPERWGHGGMRHRKYSHALLQEADNLARSLGYGGMTKAAQQIGIPRWAIADYRYRMRIQAGQPLLHPRLNGPQLDHKTVRLACLTALTYHKMKGLPLHKAFAMAGRQFNMNGDALHRRWGMGRIKL